MRNTLIRNTVIAAALLSTGAAHAQVIILAQWNFNADNTIPAVGVGSASLIGGATATFATGSVSDPGSPNRAWNTSNYPAQQTGSGTRGVQFAVSTAGMREVKLRFDVRHSNTASRWLRLDYFDGSTWTLGTAAAGRIFGATAGDTWFNNRTVDLSTVTAVNNNSNFAFRIVSIFGPPTGAFSDAATYISYAPSNPPSTYSTLGTLRYDMVTVEAVPEPATLAALGIGLAAILGRRRR
jgi:hypothetical protein